MPPKRKSPANLDGSDAEGSHLGVHVNEVESTPVPKKRGRKSLIDAILEEEARGTPAPVLPQDQWSVSLIQPQDLLPTTNPSKRRKVQSAVPSPVKQKYLSPGTPSIWGTNKGDFYSAFKGLTGSFGGICFANLGTVPVLTWFIEDPRWPKDMVDGENLCLSLVTEFKPKDQSSASTSAASLKKKGGHKRRTKRGDLSTVPTAPGDMANSIGSHGTHTATAPPPETSQSVPEKRWPCLVRSPIFDPDYPTFCECLQPHCSHHCTTAKDILSRGCTTYSWPSPEVTSYNSQSLSAKSCTNHDTGIEAHCQRDLIEDLSASAERKPRIQVQDKDSSAVIPVLSSRLPLDKIKMYAQVIPELASLLGHMERKSPILIISTTDASVNSFLPFQLPSGYGCVVLGFFDVESVECEIENSSSIPSVQPGKLSWNVRLRYAPPSDATDSNGNLAPPWWLDLPPTAETSDVTVLDSLAPVSESEGGAVEAGGSGEATTSVDARWSIIQALDGNPRRSWWHCLGCGRINQRDMLIHRRCQSCQKTEDPAPPFIIENVLQDTSTAPYPSNHAPRSMKTDNILVKEFPDMTSVYCYDFRDEPLLVETAVDPGLKKGVYVKHIFTGPYENLKVQATTLFFQIQEGIELGWQSVAAGIADGPYYSWTSPRHGWIDNEIPQCIHQVRKLISKFVNNYGDGDPGDENLLDGMLCDEPPADPQPLTGSHDAKGEDEKVTENVPINHIVALAWTASGSRRGALVSAEDSPVFILCLGANVELELERCPLDRPEPAPTAVPEHNPPVGQETVTPGSVDEGTGQKKTKGGKRSKSKKDPDPGPGAETNVNPKGKRKGISKEKAVALQPPKEKPKPKSKLKPAAPPYERLKISMVHGDVLILSGGDYFYSLTRTGMSILLFASHGVQY